MAPLEPKGRVTQVRHLYSVTCGSASVFRLTSFLHSAWRLPAAASRTGPIPSGFGGGEGGHQPGAAGGRLVQ